MRVWNHHICDQCWRDRCRNEGEPGRSPTRAANPELVRCCYCGVMTASGILVRDDPRGMSCRHPLQS